jgi:hypothetical protein
MNPSAQVTQQPENELGDFLRYWRRHRGKSQLDLSLDTGVSQRHISCVGRVSQCSQQGVVPQSVEDAGRSSS